MGNLTHQEMEYIIRNDKDAIVVDVRPFNEFKQCHFIGAINIPLDDIFSINKIVNYKTTNIFLYCASGLLSDDAKYKLEKIGYINVHNMGGIYKWTDYLYIE